MHRAVKASAIRARCEKAELTRRMVTDLDAGALEGEAIHQLLLKVVDGRLLLTESRDFNHPASNLQNPSKAYGGKSWQKIPTAPALKIRVRAIPA
jgi:hypothetical protein